MHLYGVAILILCLPSCTPFAPPIRTGHYGTPGRLRPYEVEIGGEATGPYYVPLTGGPLVSLALPHGVQIEAGTNHFADEWSFGYGGIRYTPWNPYQKPTHGAVDIEAGGGLGAVERSKSYELAGGGYAGVGVGAYIDWFSVFARTRAQLAAATSRPTTFWVSGIGGAEAAIARVVHVWAGYGIGAFGNDQGSEWGPVLDVGLSLSFDTGLGATPEQRPHVPPRPPP
jgi:hypothetical protein